MTHTKQMKKKTNNGKPWESQMSVQRDVSSQLPGASAPQSHSLPCLNQNQSLPPLNYLAVYLLTIIERMSNEGSSQKLELPFYH